MGEITGFTRTHVIFLKKNNFIHKTTTYPRLFYISPFLKDEEKRPWSDETRRGSCPLFTDGYNIFRKFFFYFQDSMLPEE